MTIYIILVLILTVSYVLFFTACLTGWALLPDWNRSTKDCSTTVSIIVAARNEEQHIGLLLNDIAAQNYPRALFELIVIDDCSEDDTAAIVNGFSLLPVKLIRMKDLVAEPRTGGSYKKKALQAGIAMATGELIVTTDADCSMKADWLSIIVTAYEHHPCHMIVSPVLFVNMKGWFERIQALDFLGMIGITGATLQFGLPALCNGANLAFRRQSFTEVKGYEGISDTDSGDDVLLMQKMARHWKNSIYFLKSNRAVVYTFAQHNLFAFTSQRIRWASKSKAYLYKRVVFILSMVYLFNLSLWSSAVLSFFNNQYLILLIFQMTLKLILEFSFLGMVASCFGQRKLLWLFLPAQLLHIIYIVVIGALGNVIQTTWKGRRIR